MGIRQSGQENEDEEKDIVDIEEVIVPSDDIEYSDESSSEVENAVELNEDVL